MIAPHRDSLYSLSVWLLRPVPRKLPAAADVRRPNFQGAFLRSLDSFPKVSSDGKLLAELKKRNPHLLFTGIQYKTSVQIEADVKKPIPLPSPTSLWIQVHDSDRSIILSKRGRDPKADAWYKEYARGKPIVEAEVTQPSGRTRLIGPVPLTMPYFVTSAIDYEFSSRRRPGENGLRSEFVTQGQSAIVIIKIDRIRQPSPKRAAALGKRRTEGARK